MIKRKRGHIVAISSISARMTFCRMVAYVTTKFGNDGFMSALYDDLCLDGHDEYIKLTTVYPGFVKTQEMLIELVKNMSSSAPMYDADYVADFIVKRILLNRRQFIVPFESCLMLIFK
jgi:all-trans-retinol dehydrogenase (NAD+)